MALLSSRYSKLSARPIDGCRDKGALIWGMSGFMVRKRAGYRQAPCEDPKILVYLLISFSD